MPLQTDSPIADPQNTLAAALPGGVSVRMVAVPEELGCGFARFDRELRYLSVSDHGLVAAPTDLIGRTMREVLGAEAAAILRPFTLRALAGEEITVELAVPLPTGETMRRLVCLIPEVGAEGQIPSFIAISLDRTEHRRLARALRESERHLSSIIELEPECVKLVGADGVLREMNPAGLRMLEVDTIDRIRGLPLLDFIAPEYRAAFVALHRTVMGGGTGRLLFLAIGLNGARRWLETHAVPYRNQAGQIDALLGITRDVTDHKLADDALRERERRLLSIYDTVGESIFHVTIEGEGRYRITSVNKAFLTTTGLSADQVEGKRIDEVIPPESVSLVLERYAAAIRGRTTVTWEEISSYPTGRLVGDVRLTPVFDDTGACTHLVGSVRDITQQTEAAETVRLAGDRLRTLSRRLLEVRETERRQLASELHDELGQALTATKINLESLQRYPEPASLALRLEESVAIVERALQQVRSLSLELRPPMLDDLGLGAAVRWLADQHARRSAIEFEIDENLFGRRMDPAIEIACFRIAQEAFNNIVRHAAARTVRVELETHEGSLHLNVRDDGIGFHVNAARRDAARGASLGLLGMEERAVLTGGGIDWISEPGRTVVHAWFPLDRGESAGSGGTAAA